MKYHDFKQATRATTLHLATDDQRILYDSACGLLQKTKAGITPIRLLGISVANFADTPMSQLDLFGNTPLPERHSELNRAIDDITTRFGRRAIRPAILFEGEKEEGEEE